MLTLLIVIVAVFVVLRWSVKQPMQAHTAYTSLENLFRKRNAR